MNDHVARTFGRNYVPNKLYADRDPLALGDHYTAHVAAMTREALHDKAAIAAELAYRDREIALGKVAYRMAEQRAIDAENKLSSAENAIALYKLAITSESPEASLMEENRQLSSRLDDERRAYVELEQDKTAVENERIALQVALNDAKLAYDKASRSIVSKALLAERDSLVLRLHQYEQALVAARTELEVTTWECESCGKSSPMTEIDLYPDLVEATEGIVVETHGQISKVE